MIETALSEGKRAGFATVEAFREKVIRREYEQFVEYRANHSVTTDSQSVRAFWDYGDPVGFLLSHPDAPSIRRGFHNLCSINIPDKKENFASLLPARTRAAKVAVFDDSIDSDGDARFEDLVEKIAEMPVLFPGLSLKKIYFSQSRKKIYLANSRGLGIKYRKSWFSLRLTFSLKDNLIDLHETRTHFSHLNPSRMTTRAYNLLNSLTDNQTVDKKAGHLLLSPEAATLLLREFSDHFKMSGKTGRSGIQFPAALNLADNPGMDFQVGSAPFDDEGVRAGETSLIKKGIWVDTISNLRTAFLNGATSSGNGFHGESAVFPEVAFSNLYVKPSVVSLKKLMEEAGQGIMVSLVKPKQIEKKKRLFSAYGYHFTGEELREPVHLYFKTDYLSLFLAVLRVSREIKFFHSQFNVGSPYLLLRTQWSPDGWFVI